MRKIKFLTRLVLIISVLTAPVGSVLAAPGLQGPAPVRGAVQSITLETDINTAVVIVSLSVIDKNGLSETVRISLETATKFGVITLDGDGNRSINTSLLGQVVEIDSASLLPEREADQHPVGTALATFFSDIAGIDYDTIMDAHGEGLGFGMIAQALWLTAKLEGDYEIFQAIVEAKQSGDYSAFILEDGTEPQNWGQLRKAILDTGKKVNPGLIISDRNNNDDTGNNNANSNGNNNGNMNNNGNGNSEEQDKDTGKDKEKNNNGNGNGKR